MSATEPQVPVLVLGGGIVGICSSLFLTQQNIKSVVIERHAGTSIHPRARSVNARTMELLRHIGLEERAHEAGKSISSSSGIHKGTTLKGVIEQKKRKPESKPSQAGKPGLYEKVCDAISPARGTFVTQDMLEPVLVDAARERGVEVRFSTECLGVEQDENGVTAKLKDRKSGETSVVRASYLIAADGAKSPVREQLGIKTTGRGDMGNLLNILFTANLRDLVAGREFSLCIIDRPEVCGLFTSINNADRWVFHLSYDPDKGEKPEDFPPERCRELLNIALGVENVDIEIISIVPWEPAVRVAERLRDGRIFLAGDAAHSMPPWGGQGANTGIGDAYNLSWKLAAVLNCKAGPDLLETYELERLDVARDAAEASAAGSDGRGIISVDKNFANAAAIAKKIYRVAGLGYFYDKGAFQFENVGPLGGASWKPWTFQSLVFSIDGRVGTRVPHLWIEEHGKRKSLVDLCGGGFVLLIASEGDAWSKAAEQVSTELGIPIPIRKIMAGGTFNSPAGTFESAVGIAADGAVLVRPDDYIGWRSRRAVSDPHAELDRVLRRILSL